jgi:hypothetical protein
MPPERLLAFVDAIHHRNPENQAILYNIENWKRYFEGDIDFVEITQRFPNHISRSNVRDLSSEAINDHTQIKKLFLGAMIWGYGERGLGPWRTCQMLNDEHAPQMHQTAVMGLGEGQISNVYTRFKLRYCGPAFFTKFFYFIGLGCNPNPLPIIFDSRVAQSFRVLVNDEGLNFADFAKVQENNQGRITAVLRYADGYINYINLINHWAHELNCRPDSVELFLFDPPQEFWQ